MNDEQAKARDSKDVWRERIAADLRRAAKPASAWRCGIEYELFGFTPGGERLDAKMIRRVLRRFAASDEELILENDKIIGARLPCGFLSVEPGGQLEFSTLPRRTLVELERDLQIYIRRLRDIAREEKIIFINAGFDPVCTLAEQRWFPKRRYEMMRPFLAKRGARAEDMMTRTCAVQASIDFSDDEDFARKMNLATRIAPVACAMFANSPFEAGKLTAYKSIRAHVWLNTDARRANGLPVVFDAESFNIDSFINYALNVPMIFVRCGDDYFDVNGISFMDFLDGKHALDFAPRFDDWREHLSTIFTDARVKNYLEMRMADCADARMTLAFAALWKGLCYDRAAMDEALKIMPRLSRATTLELQASVARDALAARHGNIEVLPLAKDFIRLATEGLTRIAPDEIRLLDVLHERVIEDEVCPADILISSWHGVWHGRIEKVIEHLRVA